MQEPYMTRKRALLRPERDLSSEWDNAGEKGGQEAAQAAHADAAAPLFARLRQHGLRRARNSPSIKLNTQ